MATNDNWNLDSGGDTFNWSSVWDAVNSALPKDSSGGTNWAGLLSAGAGTASTLNNISNQKDLGNRIVDMTKFKPYNVTTNLGSATFNPDTKTAASSLSPALGKMFDSILGTAQQGFDGINLDPAANTQGAYDLLKGMSATGEAQQRTDLESRLLAQGRLGSTGGANDTRALEEALGQKDLARQLQAIGLGQETVNNLVRNSTGLLGAGLQLGQIPNELLGVGASLGNMDAAAGGRGAEALYQTSQNAQDLRSLLMSGLLGGMGGGGAGGTSGGTAGGGSGLSSVLNSLISKGGSSLFKSLLSGSGTTQAGAELGSGTGGAFDAWAAGDAGYTGATDWTSGYDLADSFTTGSGAASTSATGAGLLGEGAGGWVSAEGAAGYGAAANSGAAASTTTGSTAGAGGASGGIGAAGAGALTIAALYMAAMEARSAGKKIKAYEGANRTLQRFNEAGVDNDYLNAKSMLNLTSTWDTPQAQAYIEGLLNSARTGSAPMNPLVSASTRDGEDYNVPVFSGSNDPYIFGINPQFESMFPGAINAAGGVTDIAKNYATYGLPGFHEYVNEISAANRAKMASIQAQIDAINQQRFGTTYAQYEQDRSNR